MLDPLDLPELLTPAEMSEEARREFARSRRPRPGQRGRQPL